MENPDEMMSPDDLNALMAFAGPVFAQAKAIDANGLRDEYGNMPKPFSDEIVQSLDITVQKAKNKIRQSVPHPQHIPVAPQQQYYETPPAPVQVVYVPQPSAPAVDDGQMEFRFDPTQQEKTNILLEEISRKLTKLVSLIESSQQSTTKAQINVKDFNSKEEVTKLTKQRYPDK